jgi:transposase
MLVARLARRLVERARTLTVEIDELTAELTQHVQALAPTLLAVPGCGVLTAAKILGETAGIDRFTSKDAYARHNGTAPLPVWSSNKARHRLSRTGNRQLNAALHRIALTQARCHPEAKTMIARRKANGDGGMEALRVLKRRLSTSFTERYTPTYSPRSSTRQLDRGASTVPTGEFLQSRRGVAGLSVIVSRRRGRPPGACLL